MPYAKLIVFALLAVAGCGDAACKDKTLFVTFSLADTSNADGIDVSVSVAGGSAKTSHVPLSGGIAKPSIEVGFPNGYPRGQSVTVELDVKLGTVLVASGAVSTTLSGGCSSVAVPLTTAPMANKHQGDACGPDDICDTGNCVDGYCCDTPCAGQCQACDVAGAIGTCTTTTDGVPHGTRPACNGTGTCGGACTGASGTACTYPPASVICGAACDGKCDGNGGCSSVAGGSCPDGFACGATGCNTSCSVDGDCQPNFHCAAPNCVRDVESDCLDGKDNNGDGLADCADPTCAPLVSCVPAAGAGNELGILQTDACPTDFPTTEPQHQGLNAPPCGTTGCGCDPILNCQVSYDISQYTDCSSPTTIMQTIPVDLAQATSAYGPCVPFGNTGINSVRLNSVSSSTTCNSLGSTTPPAITWSSTSNFCAGVRTSATCANAQQVCVAKPPAGQTMCARIPQAGASCPAGFAGQSATWYSAALDTRSCSCGCNVTQTASCKAAATFESQAAACPIGGSPTDCLIGSAGSCTNDSGMFSFCHFPTTIEAFHINAGTASNTAQCASTSSTAGSASPAGGSTICCQ